MRRRALLLGALALPAAARAANLPSAPPLTPAEAFRQAGPAGSRGALVWLHGAYDTSNPPPAAPPWVGRMARRGLDIWRFDRRGHDPLAEGGVRLAAGLRALRAGGYRRLIVAGHSRGGWIALTVLSRPNLADAVAAFDPAAHGTNPARRPAAMAAWAELMAAVAPGRTRFALVQLAEDPLDPDPPKRRALAAEAAQRAGLPFLSIFQPPRPRGHTGVYDPQFDPLFGAELARFTDPGA